jgi:hypothetical protein
VIKTLLFSVKSIYFYFKRCDEGITNEESVEMNEMIIDANGVKIKHQLPKPPIPSYQFSGLTDI